MATFWNETWTGVSSTGWPAQWGDLAGVGSATIIGDKGRLTAGPGASASVLKRLEGMADQRDINLLATFTPASTAGWKLLIGGRTPSGDLADPALAAAPSGVYAQVSRIDSTLKVLSRDGGAPVVLSSAALSSLTVGADYRIRVRLEGRRSRARVWLASVTEPTSWQIDVTDNTVHMRPGKVTIGFTTNTAGAVHSIDVDDLQVAGLDPVMPGAPAPRPRHEWTMWSRAANYAPDVALPIVSIAATRRWLGIDGAIIETGYTPKRWLALQPSRGVVIYRDGRQEFTGLVTTREQTWDAKSGQMRIKVTAVGDEQHLADRLVFPDPIRAADDQTVNDHWMTRDGAGVPTAKVASTAMWQLISDQAGPTCWPPRQVTGLTMGTDPAVGLSRIWSGLFSADGDNGVLDTLRAMSIASGENLGLQVTSRAGSLTFDVAQPTNLADDVRFSASLRNLVGYSYREQSPTCTEGLSAGQGDLHARLRKHVTTSSPLALSWGRQIWKYLDRRDTADVDELVAEATDATVEGDARVSLAVTLTDSQAATYRRDWDLGDIITIYVAPPGQVEASIEVVDVVREILLEVDSMGVESITPAIGTEDASPLPQSPTQQQLSAVGSGLAGLTSRK